MGKSLKMSSKDLWYRNLYGTKGQKMRNWPNYFFKKY